MTLELNEFKGQNLDELSMIEVAHAILEEKHEVVEFNELVNEIQNYLGKSDVEIRDNLSQFYTELNLDGSFISLGDNRWGLRSWYGIDEIDEEISHVEEEEEENRPKKKKKRLNAFATSEDDDIIDYNDDDPEDDYDEDDDDDIILDDDDDDDEKDEAEAYDADLREIVIDDEDVDVEVDEIDDDFSDDDDEEEDTDLEEEEEE